MSDKKYIKTYTAYTSGTLGGRDDGYPYTEIEMYDNIEQVARDYGKKKDEKYFEATPVNEKKFLILIKQTQEELKRIEDAKERQKKMEQLNQLKKELGLDNE